MTPVLLPSLLLGCLASPSDSPVENFDQLWTDFDQLYGGFAIRGVDWDDSYDRYRPLVSEASTDDELWQVATDMLAELDDGHVALASPGRELFHANVVRREHLDDDSFDLDIVRRHYLDVAYDADDGGCVWGMLDDDTAYIWFQWIWKEQLYIDDILEAHPGLRAIVVDLRHNGGGDSTWALQAWGRLLPEDREVFRTRTRNGPARDDFDAWQTWTMDPRGERADLDVVVLTDRWTISAGERMAMALKQVDGSVQVGVATNGAQATVVGRYLPNGWALELPVQEIEAPDGQVWEGPGVPVDVEILNDPEVLAGGTDEMLEVALELLSD